MIETLPSSLLDQQKANKRGHFRSWQNADTVIGAKTTFKLRKVFTPVNFVDPGVSFQCEITVEILFLGCVESNRKTILLNGDG